MATTFYAKYPVTSGGGGSGTVTDVSVISANGLAGTVANSTSTPAITLSTTVTANVLKGNGTAIVAAVAGTDYQAPITPGNLTDAGTDGITVTGGTNSVLSNVSIAQHVADSTHNGYLSSTDWNTFNGKGSGTVTAVSIASANGFAGSSSGGATPAITLSTSITGLLKGNGTAISAAAAGTDYVAATSGSAVQKANGAGGLTAATAGTDFSAGTSALATGILKSTTTTGALSIAASGTDYAPATSGSSILYGNGAGGFSNVTVGSGLTFSTGTLSASGGGATAMAVLTKTASYSVVTGDFSGFRLMVEMNATSAATLTLPAASNSGYEVNVINIGSAIVTIATAGSDTFGSTSDTTWTLIPGGSPQSSNTFISNGGTRWAGF